MMLGFGQDECQFCSEFISEVCLHRQHSSSPAGWGLFRVSVPCSLQDVFDPREIALSALSKDEGVWPVHTDKARWWLLQVCSCIFSSGFRRGLGHLLFLTAQQSPNPVTHCHGCVHRGVRQLEPSNPTLQQVLCGAIPSGVTQPLPALLFQCSCSERDLEEAFTN